MSGQIINQLSFILESRCMSGRSLAIEAGVQANTVYSMINGEAAGIRYETLARLCDVLEIKPADLLAYVPEVKKPAKRKK